MLIASFVCSEDLQRWIALRHQGNLFLGSQKTSITIPKKQQENDYCNQVAFSFDEASLLNNNYF